MLINIINAKALRVRDVLIVCTLPYGPVRVQSGKLSGNTCVEGLTNATELYNLANRSFFTADRCYLK